MVTWLFHLISLWRVVGCDRVLSCLVRMSAAFSDLISQKIIYLFKRLERRRFHSPGRKCFRISFFWRLIKKIRGSFWFICGEDGSLYFLKIKRPLLVFKSVLMQRNFFKSLWDECTKISESTIGDKDKLKWVTNWCQFLFQDQKMIRSHIIGNIRKVLIEETSEPDFELLHSLHEPPQCPSCEELNLDS